MTQASQLQPCPNCAELQDDLRRARLEISELTKAHATALADFYELQNAMRVHAVEAASLQADWSRLKHKCESLEAELAPHRKPSNLRHYPENPIEPPGPVAWAPSCALGADK